MDMSEKIKALRLKKHLTLEQVGDIVGVGKSTVRKWETGEIGNMGVDKIEKVAAALGVSPSYLMGWEDEDGNLIPQEYEDDPDAIWELRERLRRQPGMRILFNATENATEEELMQVVDIINVLKRKSNN